MLALNLVLLVLPRLSQRKDLLAVSKLKVSSEVFVFAVHGDKSVSITGSEATQGSLKLSWKIRASPKTASPSLPASRLESFVLLRVPCVSYHACMRSRQAEDRTGHKSSLSAFCILATPPPTNPASFSHNPPLWRLFRVGPGDRRPTECICVCVHSCVLVYWKHRMAIHAWHWMIGWLKWVSEQGPFDLILLCRGGGVSCLWQA